MDANEHERNPPETKKQNKILYQHFPLFVILALK